MSAPAMELHRVTPMIGRMVTVTAAALLDEVPGGRRGAVESLERTIAVIEDDGDY